MTSKDAFGIPMKYQRKSGGQSYFLNENIPAKKGVNGEYDIGRIVVEGNGGDIIYSNKSGFYKLTQNSKVRISMTGSDGYQSSQVVTDREQIALRGFMMTNKDLGNFELSFSFVYNGSGTDSCNVFLSGRGGKHIIARNCEGSSYKAGIKLRTPNECHISKESYNGYFPSGSVRDTTNDVFTTIQGREVFLKLCVYDVDENNIATNDKTLAVAVKIELYGGIETAEGSGEFSNLRLLHQTIDQGNWSVGADQCGNVTPDQIILWSGPIVSIGWEGLPDIDFRKLSYAEIDPTATTEIPPNLGTELPPSEEPPLQSVEEEPNDILGVRKIYQTKEGGSYFIPSLTGVINDSRFDRNEAEVTHLGNGIYQVLPGTTRMKMFSTPEANQRGEDFEGYTTYNFESLRKRGAWDNPNTDFRNMEVTIYLQHLEQANKDNDEFSLVTNSVMHDSKVQKGCGGSSYHGNIFLDGKFRFKKEQRHVDYDNKGASQKGIGNITGKTIGMKFIRYELPDNSVKLEIWADPLNKNIWDKYHEMIDKDDWGDAMTVCKALKPGAAILWGSPTVIIKCNNQKFNFSKPSVREIVSGSLIPQLPGTGGGSTGNLSRLTALWTFLWDHITDTGGQTCAGAAPPGGGTYTNRYNVSTINDDKPLSSNWSAEDNRISVGEYVNNTNSIMYQKKYTKIGFYVKKFGSPTGTLNFRSWNNNGDIVVTYGSVDISTLTTDYILYEFTKDDIASFLPNGLLQGYSVGLSISGGSSDSSNHVLVGINTSNPIDSSNSIEFQFELLSSPQLQLHSSRDCCGQFYDSP